MVSFNLISSAVLAIASVAPWSASALPVDNSDAAGFPGHHNQLNSTRFPHNGHPIITNSTIAGQRGNSNHAFPLADGIPPGLKKKLPADQSLERRGASDDEHERQQQDDDESEFPGKGHHYGRNSTEFPGKGNHYGHGHGHDHGHNRTEEFPGKGHHWGRPGRNNDTEKPEKPCGTPSFPLTALPKPSDVPSGVPSGALPSGHPKPSAPPSYDEDGDDADNESGSDKEDTPTTTTAAPASSSDVKAEATSLTASVSAQSETPSASSSGSASLSSDDSQALELHNSYRAKHSAPALTWSDTLASYAQNWADGCVFEHSQGKYGENLAMGYGDWEKAIAAWYDEVSDYDFSNGGYSSGTGHFTQMVWVDTTELGCAVSQCNGSPIYVCEYNPPGNIISGNEFKDNVLAN